MIEQTVLFATEGYPELDSYFRDNGIRSVFLVCGNSFEYLNIRDYFAGLSKAGIRVTYFSDFQPNPLYESVADGVKKFDASKSDMIVAVGGGSAIDVAKCIKLYCGMDTGENYLVQTIRANAVKLLAIPTTAGTGSEATRYAVIYYKGEKQSVSDDSCIPSMVLFDPSGLKTLPEYQRKSTMMDAFSHAVESFWSVNSTNESRDFSRSALRSILEHKDAYLANNDDGNAAMQMAAYTAGRAINITQTTGGHAMCYKLTSLYGIAHGHAAALCNMSLFSYMICNMDKCADTRGRQYLEDIFQEIAVLLGCHNAAGAVDNIRAMVDELDLPVPLASEADIDILIHSVNPVRLRNNPVRLSEEAIGQIYRDILIK